MVRGNGDVMDERESEKEDGRCDEEGMCGVDGDGERRVWNG